jgi:hypothetical protein
MPPLTQFLSERCSPARPLVLTQHLSVPSADPSADPSTVPSTSQSAGFIFPSPFSQLNAECWSKYGTQCSFQYHSQHSSV